jgi:hypothetical protein
MSEFWLSAYGWKDWETAQPYYLLVMIRSKTWKKIPTFN